MFQVGKTGSNGASEELITAGLFDEDWRWPDAAK